MTQLKIKTPSTSFAGERANLYPRSLQRREILFQMNKITRYQLITKAKCRCFESSCAVAERNPAYCNIVVLIR